MAKHDQKKPKRTVVFMSEECTPCQEIKKQIIESPEADDYEIVNIDTDEGFDRFYNDVLSKEDGALPSAFHDGQKCLIGFDNEDNVVIDCRTEEERKQAEAAPSQLTLSHIS